MPQIMISGMTFAELAQLSMAALLIMTGRHLARLQKHVRTHSRWIGEPAPRTDMTASIAAAVCKYD
jgi:hypothetical protein